MADATLSSSSSSRSMLNVCSTCSSAADSAATAISSPIEGVIARCASSRTSLTSTSMRSVTSLLPSAPEADSSAGAAVAEERGVAAGAPVAAHAELSAAGSAVGPPAGSAQSATSPAWTPTVHEERAAAAAAAASAAAVACSCSKRSSNGSVRRAVTSRLAVLDAHKLPRMKQRRISRGRSVACRLSALSIASRCSGFASMRLLTSSCSESFARTRDTLRQRSALWGTARSRLHSSSTQPECTNCLRDEPDTATLRSVAVSWTSKCTGLTLASFVPLRGVGGALSTRSVCKRSACAKTATAPRPMSAFWLAESALVFFSAPAAYSRASVVGGV
mmetsp:Transcript_18319/g.37045  ORF Transcript_18319/g.37045 Transcript_18319/m.37045 type:complete len:333 (-) Transcript_18319:321-1319(-)